MNKIMKSFDGYEVVDEYGREQIKKNADNINTLIERIQSTEEWTFELEDGTIIKKVVFIND